jgi:hypothetical protein
MKTPATASTPLVPLLLLSMRMLFLASCGALAPPVRSFRHRPSLESHRLGESVDSRHMESDSSIWPSTCIDTPKLGECWYVPEAAAAAAAAATLPTITTAVSRRSLLAMLGTIGLAAVAVAPESSLAAATAVDDDGGDEASQKAAAKERMAQRIADSKLKYRKPTDLVKDRQDNTDYSCVATTGSPCPEGLVPTSVQRELIGAFEMLK